MINDLFATLHLQFPYSACDCDVFRLRSPNRLQYTRMPITSVSLYVPSVLAPHAMVRQWYQYACGVRPHTQYWLKQMDHVTHVIRNVCMHIEQSNEFCKRNLEDSFGHGYWMCVVFALLATTKHTHTQLNEEYTAFTDTQSTQSNVRIESSISLTSFRFFSSVQPTTTNRKILARCRM